MAGSGYSARYDEALKFAAHAHRHQVRKGSETPYITHVVHVSVILLRHGFDEDLAIAGLLHDVAEDCGIAIDTLREQFGDRVATLVEAVSERKSVDGVEQSWETRKAEQLADLAQAGSDVAALKAADSIHNIQSMLTDLAEQGPSTWQRFKRGPEAILAYYRAIVALVHAKLGDHPLARELAHAQDMLSSVQSADTLK
ncbi:MAG: HD domain-containing protein [Roseiflexaceae bacterium]